MGCAASTEEFDPVKVDAFWRRSEQSAEKPRRFVHSGFKTMRLFVASTFKDFHNERFLVRNIVSSREGNQGQVESLETIAREKKLLIILEDFNSVSAEREEGSQGTGNKSEFEDPQSVYALLDAMEEAREDNGGVFYLHLLGSVGSLPPPLPLGTGKNSSHNR